MSGRVGRRQVLQGAAVAAAGLSLEARATAAPSRRETGSVQVDGISVYYETYGPELDSKTVPLVVLHGGALTIEMAFSRDFIARFERRRPVIAIEQQGHGHTPDRPGEPISIDQMVKDTGLVLAHLKVQRADVLGHSLGGIVATGLAIRYPPLIRSVTTLGAPYRLEGFRPDIVRLQRDPTFVPPPDLIRLLPTEADLAGWRASFARSAPDPTAFDRILDRLNKMLTSWKGWSDSEMRTIKSPMLVVIGDDDYVRLQHAAQMARLVMNGRLAVMPGTTHLNVVKRDAWFEPMMTALAQSSG